MYGACPEAQVPVFGEVLAWRVWHGREPHGEAAGGGRGFGLGGMRTAAGAVAGCSEHRT